MVAAILSMLVFGMVAAETVRSFWTYDVWGRTSGSDGWVLFCLQNGCFTYQHFVSSDGIVPSGFTGHFRGDATLFPFPESKPEKSVLGFAAHHEFQSPSPYEAFYLGIPLWFPLLLLLIIPVRWLIARPANAPAFPVLTKQS